MLNLTDLISLPIYCDTKEDNLVFGEEVIYDNCETITLESLIPALLNKSLKYPTEVYQEHSKIHHKNDEKIFSNGLGYDIIFLPEGLLGVEYIKTHVYYSANGGNTKETSTVVEVLFGKLTIILQKNKDPDELSFESVVVEGRMIILKAGEKTLIPTGYYYTFVNTGNSAVIFARLYKNPSRVNYVDLEKSHGMAYYCIRKNARPEIVKNPRYRQIADIEQVSPDNSYAADNDYYKSHLYDQVVGEMNFFLDLL